MLIPDEYLWECLHHPHMHPGAELNLMHLPGHRCEMVNDRVCFTGSVLREGPVFYRVDEYEETCNSWWARWPD
jgi:hypothetical protein